MRLRDRPVAVLTWLRDRGLVMPLAALVADKDPTTRRLLEDILGDEEEHADELADMLEG